MNTPPERFEPRRVQQGLVCMLFDPKYATRVRSPAALPELHPRERELLRGVDPRALATDDMRRARALQVLLDEYPVSAALLGLDVVDRYFASPVFRRCVFARGSMAHSFGRDYLGDRAKGVGALETAMVHARRPAPRPSPTALETATLALQRAPGIEALTVPAGSLAWYQRARQRLGPEPLRALAKLRKPWTQKPPRRGLEHLLIEPAADGSLALSTASAELVALLINAGTPATHAELCARAIELGAEAHESAELLAGLVDEGLLIELR